MDWITEIVAIGDTFEAQDSGLLRTSGFRSVLSLDGTGSPMRAAELGVEEIATFNLLDGHGNDIRVVERAVNSLVRMASTTPPVLVHCHAGRSRSPLIVAGYLMRVQGMDPDRAVEFVASKREVNIT